MAAFLLPALAGLGGGLLSGFFSGESKKEVHAPQEHYAPTYGARTYAPTVSDQRQVEQSYIGPTYVVDSPGATTKKEVKMDQEAVSKQIPTITAPTAGAQHTEKSGIDVTTIAIIAVVGAVAVTAVGGIFGGGKKPVRRR